jgi:hypothetical protein
VARQLAQPFQDGKGSFHTDIGTFGWLTQGHRTDQQEHWQVFIDLYDQYRTTALGKSPQS